MARDRHARASRRNGGMTGISVAARSSGRRKGSRSAPRENARPSPRAARAPRRALKGSTQIVEHLPPADRRDGARRADRRSRASNASRRAPNGDGERRDVVAGWEFLYDLDMEASPARANASNRSWLRSVESGARPASASFEGVDVVDAFARIGAFAEQILIDVRDSRGVGIDSAQAGEDALELRALPGRSAAKA